jgi:hypothetical protein
LRRFACAAIAAIALVTSSRPAHAHHYNRGHFVTAYAPCLAQNANTHTTDGIAACSPPVPLSDCATQPATALRLNAKGKTSILMHVSGRRRTRIEGIPTIETRVLLRGVEDCAGSHFHGDLDVRTVLRVHSEDPSCTSGRCTWPDLVFTQTLSCGPSGSCKMRADASVALAAQGLPALPIEFGYTAEVVRLDVLDRAGVPFLAQGVGAGEDALPQIAAARRPWRWLAFMRALMATPEAHAYGANGTGPADELFARYVRSFAPCAPNDTNTTTSDGRPACVSVPLSDCALDPANAVVPVVPPGGNFEADTKGRGKLDVAVRSDEVLVAGYLRNLETCDAQGYTGPLGIEGTFRTTLRDAGCTGGACTTVDGPLIDASADITDGSATIAVGVPFAALVGLSAPTTFSAEALVVHLLDRSGNPALTGPALLVRCNEVEGVPFCFGN